MILLQHRLNSFVRNKTLNEMKKFLLVLSAAALIAGCKSDEQNLNVSLVGLEDLGSDYVYEGWMIVNDAPVSTGTFSVTSSGSYLESFEVNREELEDATAFVLTIEPAVDPDAAPSAVHILAGDFSGDNAGLTTSHASAIGTDFTSAAGSYILATPTDGTADDENSGIWWLDPAAGPGAALTLPTLPDGWVYEGWAVTGGVPVSTGTFTAVDAVDNSDIYSGNAGGPPFPGEDFLNNAPAGLTFPTDLAGGTAVISVEPSPDNSTSPFLLKPLVGGIPADATDHTSYTMDNNASNTNPGGSVSR